MARTSKFMKHPTVILGLCPTGLGVIRELGEKNIPVYGYDDNPFSVGYYSKYCRKINCKRYASDKELLESLVNFASNQKKKPVLFCSSDRFLEFVSKHQDILLKYFATNALSLEKLSVFENKAKFAQLCQSLNIAHPETYIPHRDKDIVIIAQQIDYPAIIKPIYSHRWARTFGLKKVIKVDSPEGLFKAYSSLGVQKNNILIQEIIPGDDNNIYFFCGYFDRNSRPKEMFTGKKMRQYPIGFGTTVLARSVFVEELIAICSKLMKAVNYKGLCDIEFKWDEGLKRFKIIEVNPRVGRWYRLVTASGKTPVYSEYLDLIDSDDETRSETRFREGVTWSFFYRDILSFVDLWRLKKLSFARWVHSLGKVDVDAIFDRQDWKPTFGYLLEIGSKLIKLI